MTNWVSIWFEKKDPTPSNKYKWENVYQENQNEPPIQLVNDFLHWNIDRIMNILCGSILLEIDKFERHIKQLAK